MSAPQLAPFSEPHAPRRGRTDQLSLDPLCRENKRCLPFRYRFSPRPLPTSEPNTQTERFSPPTALSALSDGVPHLLPGRPPGGHHDHRLPRGVRLPSRRGGVQATAPRGRRRALARRGHGRSRGGPPPRSSHPPRPRAPCRHSGRLRRVRTRRHEGTSPAPSELRSRPAWLGGRWANLFLINWLASRSIRIRSGRGWPWRPSRRRPGRSA